MPAAITPPLPEYGTQPTRPGMYLGLFHGRHELDDQMTDWGFNGPLIGPLKFAHTTYTRDIKLQFERDADAKRYFPTQIEHVLSVKGDMLVYADRFYGDWTLFYAAEDDCALPPDTFRNVNRASRFVYGHKLEKR